MFSNVLVGVDGRRGGRDAIALAKHLMEPGARVTLARVYGGNVLFSSGAALALAAESHQALAAARALAERHGATIRALSVVSRQSIPYGEPIPVGWPKIRFGDEVDLLIVGSRSYGTMGRLFNGSTSNYLSRRARCPLLVLPRTAAAGDEPADTGDRSDTQAGAQRKTEALA